MYNIYMYMYVDERRQQGEAAHPFNVSGYPCALTQ